MYAVIRAGGKQYRVAPGDVIRIEKTPADALNFDVLAVTAGDGQLSRPSEARVVGAVVGEGRADKVLVFHYKRKKQFKRTIGHRQPYTAVRITEIAFDGQRFTAPEPEKKQPAPPKAKPKAAAAPAAEVKAKPAAKKAAPKKAAAKKPASKKAAPKKKK